MIYRKRPEGHFKVRVITGLGYLLRSTMCYQIGNQFPPTPRVETRLPPFESQAYMMGIIHQESVWQSRMHYPQLYTNANIVKMPYSSATTGIRTHSLLLTTPELGSYEHSATRHRDTYCPLLVKLFSLIFHLNWQTRREQVADAMPSVNSFANYALFQ